MRRGWASAAFWLACSCAPASHAGKHPFTSGADASAGSTSPGSGGAGDASGGPSGAGGMGQVSSPPQSATRDASVSNDARRDGGSRSGDPLGDAATSTNTNHALRALMSLAAMPVGSAPYFEAERVYLATGRLDRVTVRTKFMTNPSGGARTPYAAVDSVLPVDAPSDAIDGLPTQNASELPTSNQYFIRRGDGHLLYRQEDSMSIREFLRDHIADPVPAADFNPDLSTGEAEVAMVDPCAAAAAAGSRVGGSPYLIGATTALITGG